MKKRILIVGEAWGADEELAGRPFVGTSGRILKGMLRQVGIAIEECHLTNVFNFRPRNNDLKTLYGPREEAIPDYRPIQKNKYVRAEFKPELDRLFEEIAYHEPNVIIALGNTPLWALSKKDGIRRYRGSPLMTHDDSCKVLPTYHPAAVGRQWELRPIVIADLQKAKEESEFPELHRPRRLIYMEPSIQDIKDFYIEYLRNQPFISCDIETKELTITEVGFGTADGKRAIVIPFWKRASADGNYWSTFEEEREAWLIIKTICETHVLIGQNFSYDMKYFWQLLGIRCFHFGGDTMLMHHSLQPEMEKSLGFLGSIYTKEPSWKFMRTDHSTLKLGDD